MQASLQYTTNGATWSYNYEASTLKVTHMNQGVKLISIDIGNRKGGSARLSHLTPTEAKYLAHSLLAAVEKRQLAITEGKMHKGL